MYFPLLRGKQFELLALREIASHISGVNVVSPVIEPVKIDTSAINKATQALIKHNINFNIILNTNVLLTELDKHMEGMCALINNNLCNYDNYQVAIIINGASDFKKTFKFVDEQDLTKNRFSLIHNEQMEDMTLINKFSDKYSVLFNIINSENVNKRYHRNFKKDTLVSLDDPFNQRKRNIDYYNIIDEFFSDDYLYYKDEGYTGFGDFLTIGKEYKDSGFTPYTVAIHLTYLESNIIKISHFVSDSDSTTNYAIDVPKKYLEAVSKLIDFVDERKIDTVAVREFRRLKNNYPGLGIVKKLSVMNHIELMYSLLSK